MCSVNYGAKGVPMSNPTPPPKLPPKPPPFTDSETSNANKMRKYSIRVYDASGQLFLECSGRYEIYYEGNRIILEDEDGKTHIVYCPIGTVVIDEI